MAYKRRTISQSIRLTGAPVAAGDTILWRAPFAGKLQALRALRTGGASSVVNVKVGATTVLPTNLTAGNGSFASGVPLSTNTNARFVAGDVLSVTVVSGDATLVVLQLDLDVNQDV